MKRCIRAAVVAMLVLCSCGIGPRLSVAQGNVDGTVYTSPTFGYQLQWASPWFFVEETSENGIDTLFLYDGASEANFLFGFAPGITFQDVVTQSTSETLPGVSNIQPMLDPQGNPVAGVNGVNGEQEWAVYTATQALDDGSTIDFMQYFNFRTLGGGVILMMSGVTVSYFWDEPSLQSWHDMANTILVVDAVAPLEPTSAPEVLIPTPTALSEQRPGPDQSPTPTPELPASSPTTGDGEPAPAFAAGPWRVAVRAVDQGAAIDYLGLGFVDGSQWVVVYADVTNWSAADATLDVNGMTLATAGAPVAPDLANTRATAASLGLEPANGSSVPVPAGGSIRVALVYQLPVSENMRVLILDGQQLPLDDAAGRQLDVTDLSTVATPPAMQTGTVGTVPLEGPEVQFFVETSDGPIRITLAGVELPTDASCYEGSTDLLATLGTLYGTTVLLETDPAVTAPDTYYVWIEDEQGNRALLNQTLVANGLVVEGDLPDAARFGAWIEQSESLAQVAGVGIWSTCAGQL